MSDITAERAQQARLRQRLNNSLLGRYGAPELLWTQPVTFAAPITYQAPTNLTIDRPIAALHARLTGRLVVGAAAYTTGVVESFLNLIQNIKVQGQHIVWGNTTPINMSGATAFVYPKLAGQQVGNTFLSGTTRQADPGQPFVQTANLITTPATGTIDFDLTISLPTGPFLGPSPSAKRFWVPFLWRYEDWGNSLQFFVSFGDKTALGTPDAATTATWTAFGSAAGTPTFALYATYALLGPTRFGYVPGSNAVVIRNEQPVPTQLTSVANNQLLATLQPQITTQVIVKSGVKLTGTSAGVNVYSTLSDVQLDNTKILVGNRTIKNTGSNIAFKNYDQFMGAGVTPQGYLVLPFMEGGSPFLAFRGDKQASGANFQMWTDVLSASANNWQNYIQEYVLNNGAAGPFLDVQ